MTRLLARPAAWTLTACVLLFLGNHVLEALHASTPWLRGRLDDVLMLPLALGAALVLHRWRGRPARWTLPVGQVVLAAALLGAVFEGLLPLLDGRATADPADLAAYAAGGGLFAVLINRPAGGAPR
ncbi:hypothetical protein KDK88_09595 [bacterium]|nr:hypothetical protein [bacterium]HPF35679.1 hypothetical protein [Candidatus Krumholzibacteria bacterium]HRX51363.1 hypothetical protein [Candidatus Krumholzibacteria bacterium]